MRIIVKDGGERSIRLRIPTGLVLNRFTAVFLPGVLAQAGIRITRRQAAAFIKEINACRRRCRDWILVEAQSAGSERIEIRI